MTHLIIVYLPFLLSAVTIACMVMAGNKHPHTWLYGLLNQALWLTWIVTSRTWGLLPTVIFLSGVYIRNHLKWRAHN